MTNISSALQFRDANRSQSKACIVIEGLAGKGKTGLALAMGYALSNKDWSKLYSIDTENRSQDLFEGLTIHTGVPVGKFKKVDLLPLHGYAPSNYLLCKENAKKAGALCVVNDSVTHMWQQAGGILQTVTELDRLNAKVNKFSAWGTPEVVKEKNAVYDCVRDSGVHVISTVRIKEKFEMVDGKVSSIGEQQIFMPDFKYEPDLVLHMVSAGAMNGTAPVAEVIKSRYAILEEGSTYAFTEALIDQIVSYLNEGTDPSVLQEQQRLDYIKAVTETIEANVSKKTMLPILKEQIGCKDMKLTDMPLDKVRTLLGMLIN